jgi:hypothetical protein
LKTFADKINLKDKRNETKATVVKNKVKVKKASKNKRYNKS